MLNYHYLRYFWIVAHEGNLTRAAEKIAIAQSALSMQIRQLETELGQPLFERQHRRLILTEAGRIALEFADSIFATGEELVGTLNQLAHTNRRALRVGALATLSKNFQFQFVAPLLKQAEVQVVIRSGTMGDLLQRLEAYQLDVVLANVEPLRDANTLWISHTIDQQPVSLVGRPHAKWQGRTLTDLLSQEGLALPMLPSSIRTGFDSLVHRLNVRPRITAEVDDMAMLRLVARNHDGLAVVPPIVVKDELDSGVLEEVAKLPALEETFFAITAARRFPNPLLDLVLAKGGRSDHEQTVPNTEHP